MLAISISVRINVPCNFRVFEQLNCSFEALASVLYNGMVSHKYRVITAANLSRDKYAHSIIGVVAQPWFASDLCTVALLLCTETAKEASTVAARGVGKDKGIRYDKG